MHQHDSLYIGDGLHRMLSVLTRIANLTACDQPGRSEASNPTTSIAASLSADARWGALMAPFSSSWLRPMKRQYVSTDCRVRLFNITYEQPIPLLGTPASVVPGRWNCPID